MLPNNRLSGDLRAYAKEIVDEWIGDRSQLYKGYVIWAAPVTTGVPIRWSVDVVIERHHAGELKKARHEAGETRLTKDAAVASSLAFGRESSVVEESRCFYWNGPL